MSDAKKPYHSIVHVFPNRNFKFLWIGAIASASGFYVGNVVIEWLIYASTRAALLLTVLGIIEFIPTLTIGVIAGALVDRHDRRHLMIATDLARAAAMGGLAVFVLFLGFNPMVVLATVFVTATLGSIFNPASAAILPSIVDKSKLSDSNALLETGTTIAGFIGSPLGGALIVTVGVGFGLIYNSITFAISALMIGLMIIPSTLQENTEKPKEGEASLMGDVKAGLRYLRTQSSLLTMTVASMILNFFTFYQLYTVVYVYTVLHAGPAIFGILVGAGTAGYILGALMASHLKTERVPGIWVPAAWGLGGVPLITLILFPVVPLAITSMVAEGFLSALVNITFISVVQRIVPDEFLGRYFATNQAGSYAMIPAGLVVGGILVVAFGIGPAFLFSGLGTIIIGLSLLLSSNIRKWGRMTEPPTKPLESK